MKKLVFVFAVPLSLAALSLINANIDGKLAGWCIALALCVGGSAYASKGGNLGTRALTQLKAAVQSKLSALGNGELAHKSANSKIAHTIAAGVLVGILVCSGSGCGNDEGIVTETEMVEVQVIDHYDGDSIYFTIGSNIYEGRVIEGISENEVLVRLADGSDMVARVDRIGGTLIADHPDIGVEVVLRGNRDKGEKLLIAEIDGVFTDDVRKIKILTIDYLDDGREVLDVPRIRFVHEDTDYEDGGYLTIDEFIEWLDN